jgi:hypothetical protein
MHVPKSDMLKLQALHFISSGIKEMIEATEIGKKFTKVFASSFAYDANGAGPNGQRSRLITPQRRSIYSASTRVSLSVHDHGLINDFVPHRRSPYAIQQYRSLLVTVRQIFPCNAACQRSAGGHSIAVYQPDSSKKKTLRAEKLITDKRADFIAPAGLF